MPPSATFPVGSPCWTDLQTSSPDGVRSFYPRVLGWEALAASAEFGGYFMFTRHGVPVAGCMPSDAQAPVSDVWSVYLSAPDAAKTVASAAEHGGQVVVPPMPVADLGTMAFVIDPAGAGIGIWQPDTFPGFGLRNEAGAPCWFDAMTRDHDAAVAFYRDVFGWHTEAHADPGARMTVQVPPDGGDPLCGIMDARGWMPDEVPAHWTPYFGVPDTDAAIAEAEAAGGRVLVPANDSPYGRFAKLADPFGAGFSIVSVPAS